MAAAGIPNVDPSQSEGKRLALELTKARVRSTTNYTEQQLQQGLDVVDFDKVDMSCTADRVAQITSKSLGDVLRVLLDNDAVRHGEQYHYYGEIQMKRDGRPKINSHNRKQVIVTAQGMITVVGLLLADTPALAPYLNCITALIATLLNVIGEMQLRWNELQEERSRRMTEVSAFQSQVAAITQLDEKAVISATAHTYGSAYKDFYYRNMHTKEALDSVGALEPYMLDEKNKLKGKAHHYHSAFTSTMEAARMALLRESISLRKDEIDALDGPEEKKRKVKEVTEEVHKDLLQNKFGSIPGATAEQQRRACLRHGHVMPDN